MKIICVIVFLLMPMTIEANQKYDTSKLNPCLKELYSRLTNKENLVGETHTCNLILKFANKEWFLFMDGYVRLDETTRYSFLKFTKIIKLPDNINRFKNVKITFKIIATSESLNSDGWPALEVQLIQIHPNKEINHDSFFVDQKSTTKK